MYQLLPDQFGQPAQCVKRLSDSAFIPFDLANTDYQRFKYEINNDEAGLEDADGVLMTAEQVEEFLQTLP